MENTLAVKPETRPEEIDRILNSLERYNSENIDVLQNYVKQQADGEQCDIAANLALLKLYQFTTNTAKDDYIVMVLTKALVRFYTSDFSTAMHLLPPYVTSIEESSLKDQVEKLFELYRLLDACKFGEFWSKLDNDDSYADLVADVKGFDEDVRFGIAKTLEISSRQIAVNVLKEWLNITNDQKFKQFVENEMNWSFTKNGESVAIPLNKDNDTKPVITNETVKFEQLTRLIKHAYEQNVAV